MAFWKEEFWTKTMPKINPIACTIKAIVDKDAGCFEDLGKSYAKAGIGGAVGAVGGGPASALTGFSAVLIGKAAEADTKDGGLGL